MANSRKEYKGNSQSPFRNVEVLYWSEDEKIKQSEHTLVRDLNAVSIEVSSAQENHENLRAVRLYQYLSCGWVCGRRIAVTGRGRAMIAVTPYYFSTLPWSSGEDENRRFKRFVLITLILTIVLTALVFFIEVPEQTREEKAKIPPQLAKILEAEEPPVVELPEPEPEPEPEPGQRVDEEDDVLFGDAPEQRTKNPRYN